jgi:peptide-methionine (R)-S-oxide reductase
MMSRRLFLKSSLFAPAAVVAAGGPLAFIGQALAANIQKVTHSDDEWRKLLSDEQYQVLRHEATERPFTSVLLEEHRDGTFTCAGCDLPLFSSRTKYDSGTGWPSFWQALDGAVKDKRDESFGMVRIASECARCDGHLGHLFDDGPQPTGLRYCMNGVALKFVAAAA